MAISSRAETCRAFNSDRCMVSSVPGWEVRGGGGNYAV
jgi:hypothetical protein